MSPAVILTILVSSSSALSDQTQFSGRIDERLSIMQLTTRDGVVIARDDTTTIALGGEGARGLMPARCTDQRGGLLIVVSRDERGDVLHALGRAGDGRLGLVFSAPLPAPALSLAAGGTTACRIVVVAEGGLVVTAALRDEERFTVLAPAVEVPDDPREYPRGPPMVINDDRVVVGDGAGVRVWSDLGEGSIHADLPAWPVSPALSSSRGALFATPDGSVWHVDEAGAVERLPGSGAETGPIHSGLALIDGAVWWGTLDGRVFTTDGRGVRRVADLSAGVRQPLLFADLVDRGRPQVVAIAEDASVTLLDPAGLVPPMRLALGARSLGVTRVLVDEGEAPLLTAPSGRIRFLGPTFAAERLPGPPASTPTPPGAIDLPGSVVGPRPDFVFPSSANAPMVLTPPLRPVAGTSPTTTSPDAPGPGCTASPPSTFGPGLVLMLVVARRRGRGDLHGGRGWRSTTGARRQDPGHERLEQLDASHAEPTATVGQGTFRAESSPDSLRRS